MSQPVSGYLYPTNLVLGKTSTTVSSTANTTGVNLKQFDSGGITLIFQVSAIAGGGSLAISAEESYDDVTYSAITGATDTFNTSDVGTVSTLFIPNFQGPYLRLAQTLTGTMATYSYIVYGNPAAATSSAGYSTAPTSQSL